MHFSSLYFGSILILVPKLISLEISSLKKETHFKNHPCRQLTNGNLLRGRWNALLADVALMWPLKYYLKKLFGIFLMLRQHLNFFLKAKLENL